MTRNIYMDPYTNMPHQSNVHSQAGIVSLVYTSLNYNINLITIKSNQFGTIFQVFKSGLLTCF